MLLPVATEFDENTNTLFAETDEMGTYCVLDMEILMQNLGIEPNTAQVVNVSKTAYSSVALDDNAWNTVTFIIDTRESEVTNLDQIKDEIISFMSYAALNKKRVSVNIFTQNIDSLDESEKCCEYVGTFKDVDSLKAGLENVKLSEKHSSDSILEPVCEITDGILLTSSQNPNSKNFIFDIYAQKNAYFEDDKFNQIEQNALSSNVNISIITNMYNLSKLDDKQSHLPEVTGGIIVNTISHFAKKAYSHIFGEPLIEFEEGTFAAILSTGYQFISLDANLSPTNDADTDDDTLSDWKEVGVDYWISKELITFDSNNNIKLPTIKECMGASERTYVERGLERFQNGQGIDFSIDFLARRIMPILSDPTNIDSDADGIMDYDEDINLRLCIHRSSYKAHESFLFAEDGNGYNNHVFYINDTDSSVADEADSTKNLKYGYYRFEVYSKDKVNISFDDLNQNYEVMRDEIDEYTDVRIYRKIDKENDIINFSVVGDVGTSYNLYVTRVTAYLCGGIYSDEFKLDTTMDVDVLEGLFSLNGYDVVKYDCSSPDDVYNYKADGPFNCTHNEVMVYTGHGDAGKVKDYNTGNDVFIPADERAFSQNQLTIFASCKSADDIGGLLSVAEQCLNAGAGTTIGFYNFIDDQGARRYCASLIFEMLTDSAHSIEYHIINNKVSIKTLYPDAKDGIDGDIEIYGDKSLHFFPYKSGTHYKGYDFTKFLNVKEYISVLERGK